MEEGIFPLSRASYDDDLMEEERRLAYVGITRAKKRLFLSHARTRMLYNARQANELSRFVTESPARLITDGTQRGETRRVPAPPTQRSRMDYGAQAQYYSGRGTGAVRQKTSTTASSTAMGIPGLQKGMNANAKFVGSQARTAKPIALFKPGDRVVHRVFGKGQVLEVSGEGVDQKVKVDFGERGVKSFNSNIAPIVKVNG